MKNPGKDFQRRFRDRLVKRHGCFVERVYDASMFQGEEREREASGEEKKKSFRRFSRSPGYDFRVSKPASVMGTSYSWAIECKTTLGDRFNFSMLTKEERRVLPTFPPWVPALVVVEMRSHGRCFVVSIGQIIDREEFGLKSMNMGYFGEHAVELPRNSTKLEKLDYYDMTRLLEYVA